MIINDICAEQDCKHYIEWEFSNNEYEQPYICTSCKLQGQSYDITEIAEACPFRDIVEQRLSDIKTSDEP